MIEPIITVAMTEDEFEATIDSWIANYFCPFFGVDTIECPQGNGCVDCNKCFSERVVRVDPPKPKRWRAEKNQRYYYVGGDGNVYEMYDDYYDSDNRRYNVGNYFQTRELAEQSKFYRMYREDGE